MLLLIATFNIPLDIKRYDQIYFAFESTTFLYLVTALFNRKVSVTTFFIFFVFVCWFFLHVLTDWLNIWFDEINNYEKTASWWMFVASMLFTVVFSFFKREKFQLVSDKYSDNNCYIARKKPITFRDYLLSLFNQKPYTSYAVVIKGKMLTYNKETLLSERDYDPNNNLYCLQLLNAPPDSIIRFVLSKINKSGDKALINDKDFMNNIDVFS
jgi:hypothetical protein